MMIRNLKASKELRQALGARCIPGLPTGVGRSSAHQTHLLPHLRARQHFGSTRHFVAGDRGVSEWLFTPRRRAGGDKPLRCLHFRGRPDRLEEFVPEGPHRLISIKQRWWAATVLSVVPRAHPLRAHILIAPAAPTPHLMEGRAALGVGFHLNVARHVLGPRD